MSTDPLTGVQRQVKGSAGRKGKEQRKTVSTDIPVLQRRQVQRWSCPALDLGLTPGQPSRRSCHDNRHGGREGFQAEVGSVSSPGSSFFQSPPNSWNLVVSSATVAVSLLLVLTFLTVLCLWKGRGRARKGKPHRLL